jgi:cytochrome c oxidase subunit 2
MTLPPSPAAPSPHDASADRVERVERRWAMVSVVIIALLVVVAIFAGLHQATMPQSVAETTDPRTLHLNGEFIESNLGSATEPDGSVTVRAVGQQYSFTPHCILVPTNTPINFRVTSADVVHGLMIIDTNVNLMLVPGYISTISATFGTTGSRHMPCHEFCGVGHQGMWGEIQVVDKTAFDRMAATERRVRCAE